MKPVTSRTPQGRSIGGKMMLALAVAPLMVGLATGPAFSDDHQRRVGPPRHDQRGHYPSPRGHQPRGHYVPPVVYAPPPTVIYAPPPVVYAPPPSPGISLFFEIPFRHR
jgi:hypothetical protein